jgi:hypothetical protein
VSRPFRILNDRGHRLRRFGFASTSVVALCIATIAHAEPRARIEGVTDKDLRERLETAVGEVEGEPGSRFEARRRVNEAAERAVALLRSEGYYGHTVDPTIGVGEDPPRPCCGSTRVRASPSRRPPSLSPGRRRPMMLRPLRPRRWV